MHDRIFPCVLNVLDSVTLHKSLVILTLETGFCNFNSYIFIPLPVELRNITIIVTFDCYFIVSVF
jgi:hypothetical protein